MDKNKLKIKDYWNKQPCNSKRSKAIWGSNEWCNDTAINKYKVEPHIKNFADFDEYKNKKVLEIGCGIGIDTCSFAKAGALVTAIDISKESVKLANIRAYRNKVCNNIKFYVGDAEELNTVIPVEKYDLIYSFGVIHHTPNPRKVFENIKEYMNSDTELKIMLYHNFSWKVFCIYLDYFIKFKFLEYPIKNQIAQHSEAQTGCPFTYSYSKENIRKLLKDFRIIDLRIDHIFSYSIPEYLKGNYKKVWYFKWMSPKLFKWLESKIGWHLLVTAKLK